MERLERDSRELSLLTLRGAATRLDLAEDERAAVKRDDVKFTPPRAEVALDDREPSTQEMIGREVLAAPPDLAPVHGHDRTAEAAPDGIPHVTIVRRVTVRDGADLARGVTHTRIGAY